MDTFKIKIFKLSCLFNLGVFTTEGKVKKVTFKDWLFDGIYMPQGQAVKSLIQLRPGTKDLLEDFTFKNIYNDGNKITELDNLVDIKCPDNVKNIKME